MSPRIIATIGYFPAKYILSKHGLTSDFIIIEVCGETFLSDDRIILPLIHPALLLYNPDMEEEFKKKYRKLSVLLGSLC